MVLVAAAGQGPQRLPAGQPGRQPLPCRAAGHAATGWAARFAQPAKCRLRGSAGGIAAQPDSPAPAVRRRDSSTARYQLPCPRSRRCGQRRPSCRPVRGSRQPHRLNVDPPDRDMTVLPPQQLRLHGRQTRLSWAGPDAEWKGCRASAGSRMIWGRGHARRDGGPSVSPRLAATTGNRAGDYRQRGARNADYRSIVDRESAAGTARKIANSGR